MERRRRGGGGGVTLWLCLLKRFLNECRCVIGLMLLGSGVRQDC